MPLWHVWPELIGVYLNSKKMKGKKMANEPSRTIGKIDCTTCGEEMPVRQNGRDTLNLSCPWCGISSYAKGSSEAHGIVMGWLRKDNVAGGAVKPAALEVKEVKAAPAAPAKKPTETIFG